MAIVYCMLWCSVSIERAFLAQFAAFNNEEKRSQSSSIKEGLQEMGPQDVNPLSDHSMPLQLEHAQNGMGPGPRAEVSEDDYDGPLEAHPSVYEAARGTEDMSLPMFAHVTRGMSPHDTSSLPVELEDSMHTAPRPSDRASTADEQRDQVASLNDIAGSSQFEMRSRHSSGNSARSQPSLTPAPPTRQLTRHHSSHSKVGRRISGLHTEHELTRFESRAPTSRKGRVRRGKHKSVYLDEGEQHRVWLPRLQTDVELPLPPARSHPSLNHSFSMTDMQGRQVVPQPTTPDPMKNLVANRKRLESRVKAAQEVGRQVSQEPLLIGGDTHSTCIAHTHLQTCIHMVCDNI